MRHFRKFRDTVKVTPFMKASAELRCKDLRGVHPYHWLYMAVKIMRRVRDCLTIAFKHVGTDTNITKEQVQSEEYIHIFNFLIMLYLVPVLILSFMHISCTNTMFHIWRLLFFSYDMYFSPFITWNKWYIPPTRIDSYRQ